MTDLNSEVDSSTPDTGDAVDAEAKETQETKPLIDGEKAPDEGDKEPSEEEGEKDADKSDDDSEDDDKDKEEFVDFDFDNDVKLPENVTLSDDNKTIINELGKKYNLPKEAAQEIVDGFLKANESNAKAQDEAVTAQLEKIKADNVETMKKEYGDQFDGNMQKIKVAFETVPEETGFREFLSESGNDYDPRFARMMVWLHDSISDDSFEGSGAPNGAAKKEYKKYSDILPQDNIHNTKKTTL